MAQIIAVLMSLATGLALTAQGTPEPRSPEAVAIPKPETTISVPAKHSKAVAWTYFPSGAPESFHWDAEKQQLYLGKKNLIRVATNLAYCEGKLVFVQNKELVCLNVATGVKLWGYPLVDSTDPDKVKAAKIRINGPTFHAGRVYVSDQDFALHAINLSTGARIWKKTFEVRNTSAESVPEVTLPLFIEDRLVIGTGHFKRGLVICLQEEDGRVLWQFEAANTAIESTPILKGGLILAGGGPLAFALDTKYGEIVWKYEMYSKQSSIHGDFREFGDKVCFSAASACQATKWPEPDTFDKSGFWIGPSLGHSPSNTIDTHNPGPSGTPGRSEFDSISRSSSPISQGPKPFFGYIECLEAKSGKRVWQYSNGSHGLLQLVRNSAVMADASSIFGIKGPAYLVVVDLENGKARFKVRNPEGWPPVLLNDRMCVSTTCTILNLPGAKSDAGALAVYSLENGELLHSVSRSSPTVGSPTLVDGMVLACFLNKETKKTELVAVDIDSKKEVWTFNLDQQVTQQPLPTPEGLILASGDNIMCLR